MNYSFAQFEQDVQAVKPRFFDTYVLPAFLIYASIRTGKKDKAGKVIPLRKNMRRILFTSGVYMFYRNYSQYKKAYLALAAKIKPEAIV